MNKENWPDGWPSDEEIEHLYTYVHEEAASYERALDLIEHERLDASALRHLNGGTMAKTDKLDSSVDVKDFGNCSVHGGKGRRVNLSLSGYGYGQRKPDFHATPDSLNLYMSVREARAVITKLEELLKATKEKVS